MAQETCLTATPVPTWEQRKRIYNRNYFDGNLPGHYRKWWWTDFAVWGPRARAVYEAFKPENALVCGCAKGSLVKFLFGIYGVDAVGFDLSYYAIETTPYPEIRGRLMVHDLALEKLRFPDRQFDVVLCFDFLEHQDTEHYDFVCRELSRVAGGHVLIRQPIVNLPPQQYQDLLNRTAGMQMEDRMAVLRAEDGYAEFQPSEAEVEHPQTRSRAEIASSFLEFREISLEPYLYDILMGSDPTCQTQVLPFCDTIVLARILA